MIGGEVIMTCPNCNQETDNDSEFCQKCGEVIKENAEGNKKGVISLISISIPFIVALLLILIVNFLSLFEVKMMVSYTSIVLFVLYILGLLVYAYLKVKYPRYRIVTIFLIIYILLGLGLFVILPIAVKTLFDNIVDFLDGCASLG